MAKARVRERVREIIEQLRSEGISWGHPAFVDVSLARLRAAFQECDEGANIQEWYGAVYDLRVADERAAAIGVGAEVAAKLKPTRRERSSGLLSLFEGI